MCAHCKNPETVCSIKGVKKGKSISLSCKSCGNHTSLDPSNRFVKYMLQHPPDNAVENMEDAEAEKKTTKSNKSKCLSCGHKTSKPTCSKCGASVRSGCDTREGDSDGEHDHD